MKRTRKQSKRTPTKLAAVVLAAGKGTRMRSQAAKVLHPLCGLPLGAWPIEAARLAGASPTVVVVGHQAGEVQATLSAACPEADLRFAIQAEQKGTGHAVMCAWRDLERSGAEHVLILCGDVPSLTQATMRRLTRAGSGADVALLTFGASEPGSYGRILRDESGRVTEIVEAADASTSQKRINEVNAGIYCVKTSFLGKALGTLEADNAQGELYLTDLVAYAAKSGREVVAIGTSEEEVEGVNDRADLARAAARLRARINEQLMRGGVSFEDPFATYVDAGIKVGRDTLLCAGVHLRGKTRIEPNVLIEPYSILRDARVGKGAHIKAHSVIEDADIGRGAKVGPFARLRPGTVLERDAAIGNFVEAKKAHLGKGVKAGHLSYLGDARIGAGTNIGAGTITCNYDGKLKHETRIGSSAFIGSNTALVAPVNIGSKAYVGAGSTVTRDIPDGALGVARGRQRNLDGWARRKEDNESSRVTGEKTEEPKTGARGKSKRRSRAN